MVRWIKRALALLGVVLVVALGFLAEPVTGQEPEGAPPTTEASAEPTQPTTPGSSVPPSGFTVPNNAIVLTTAPAATHASVYVPLTAPAGEKQTLLGFEVNLSSGVGEVRLANDTAFTPRESEPGKPIGLLVKVSGLAGPGPVTGSFHVVTPTGPGYVGSISVTRQAGTSSVAVGGAGPTGLDFDTSDSAFRTSVQLLPQATGLRTRVAFRPLRSSTTGEVVLTGVRNGADVTVGELAFEGVKAITFDLVATLPDVGIYQGEMTLTVGDEAPTSVPITIERTGTALALTFSSVTVESSSNGAALTVAVQSATSAQLRLDRVLTVTTSDQVGGVPVTGQKFKVDGVEIEGDVFPIAADTETHLWVPFSGQLASGAYTARLTLTADGRPGRFEQTATFNRRAEWTTAAGWILLGVAVSIAGGLLLGAGPKRLAIDLQISRARARLRSMGIAGIDPGDAGLATRIDLDLQAQGDLLRHFNAGGVDKINPLQSQVDVLVRVVAVDRQARTLPPIQRDVARSALVPVRRWLLNADVETPVDDAVRADLGKAEKAIDPSAFNAARALQIVTSLESAASLASFADRSKELISELKAASAVGGDALVLAQVVARADQELRSALVTNLNDRAAAEAPAGTTDWEAVRRALHAAVATIEGDVGLEAVRSAYRSAVRSELSSRVQGLGTVTSEPTVVKELTEATKALAEDRLSDATTAYGKAVSAFEKVKPADAPAPAPPARLETEIVALTSDLAGTLSSEFDKVLNEAEIRHLAPVIDAALTDVNARLLEAAERLDRQGEGDLEVRDAGYENAPDSDSSGVDSYVSLEPATADVEAGAAVLPPIPDPWQIRRRATFVQSCGLVITAATAVVLGLQTLYGNNLTWGQTLDVLGAIVWGAGIQGVSYAGVAGLAQRISAPPADAPAA